MAPARAAKWSASTPTARWCSTTADIGADSSPAKYRCAEVEVPSMILVLDCGHSRLVWALAGERGWEASGSLPNQEIGTLALRDWQNLPRPMRAVGVNVAGEAARVRVEAQLVRWRIMPEWLIATEAAGGVINSYARPSQLGADPTPKCIISGGAADEIAPHLTAPVEVVDNLVIEGVLALATADQ